MLYKAHFERINFGFEPALKQTADVVFETDIPYEDEYLEKFEQVKWDAMWEQNPHWQNPQGPLPSCAGWSSVLGGDTIEKIKITRLQKKIKGG